MVSLLRLSQMLALSAAVLTLSVQAKAQDAAPAADSDWALTVLPERRATLAVVDFSSGISIAARCIDGTYDVILAGLPAAPGRATTRELALAVGEAGELQTTVWSVAEDRTSAFSRIPAMVARELAKGGQLQIVVPAVEPGGRRTRYLSSLTPSSRAIEQTLTACGRALVDPRNSRYDGNGQDGLPSPLEWVRMPQPEFPESVRGKIPTEGYVVLSCVTGANGSITNCQTESEAPSGFRLTESVLDSLGPARLKLSEAAVESGAKLEGRLFVFTVNFVLRGREPFGPRPPR